MTDDVAATAETTSPPPRRPWNLHPVLTEERLIAAARLFARGRTDALAHADPWMGDNASSIGCRAHAFSKHQLARAAESGRYPWLGILDETHNFAFLVDGVPGRCARV